jgi:hypothetical protein
VGAVLITGLGVAPAYADTGGGCWDASNSRVCISVAAGTTNPLRSDYYLFSRSRGEYRAEAFLLTNYSAGGCTANNGSDASHLGTREPVPLGHSPVYTRNKPSGRNCARTHVIFRDSSGRWIYDNYSPWQRW